MQGKRPDIFVVNSFGSGFQVILETEQSWAVLLHTFLVHA
jgi:hypothetical protein